MPKQDFNKGLESKGPHRQGEKGGKEGDIKTDGRPDKKASGKKGNQQIGPFDKRDGDKRARVSSKGRKTSNN